MFAQGDIEIAAERDHEQGPQNGIELNSSTSHENNDDDEPPRIEERILGQKQFCEVLQGLSQ